MAAVEATREGAVQTITLNRPDKLNAFTREVHEGLQVATRGGAAIPRCGQSSSRARAAVFLRVRI